MAYLDETGLTRVWGKVKALNNAIGTRLTTAEEKLTTVEGNITNLQGRVTTAEGNITSVEDNIASLSGRVTTAEGELTTIETDITNLQDRVEIAEEELDEIDALATEAKELANTAKTAADSAQASANSAQASADNAGQAASNAQTAAEAARKASFKLYGTRSWSDSTVAMYGGIGHQDSWNRTDGYYNGTIEKGEVIIITVTLTDHNNRVADLYVQADANAAANSPVTGTVIQFQGLNAYFWHDNNGAHVWTDNSETIIKDGIDIKKSGTSVAQFKDGSARIGKSTGDNLEFGTKKMTFTTALGNLKFFVDTVGGGIKCTLNNLQTIATKIFTISCYYKDSNDYEYEGTITQGIATVSNSTEAVVKVTAEARTDQTKTAEIECGAVSDSTERTSFIYLKADNVKVGGPNGTNVIPVKKLAAYNQTTAETERRPATGVINIIDFGVAKTVSVELNVNWTPGANVSSGECYRIATIESGYRPVGRIIALSASRAVTSNASIAFSSWVNSDGEIYLRTHGALTSGTAYNYIKISGSYII